MNYELLHYQSSYLAQLTWKVTTNTYLHTSNTFLTSRLATFSNEGNTTFVYGNIHLHVHVLKKDAIHSNWEHSKMKHSFMKGNHRWLSWTLQAHSNLTLNKDTCIIHVVNCEIGPILEFLFKSCKIYRYLFI